MPDLDDIRERHADCREGQCMVTCDPADGRPIGCDTVVVLAALDKAEAALAECQAKAASFREWAHLRYGDLTADVDAARADAKALAVKVGVLTIQRNVLAKSLAALMDNAVEVWITPEATVMAMQNDDMTAARVALAAHKEATDA